MKHNVFKLFVSRLAAASNWRSSGVKFHRQRRAAQRRPAVLVAGERLEDRTLLSSYNNLNPIAIPDSGASTPYPSVISVVIPTGVTATVLDVNVHLNGVTHTSADDIDALLVGPTGANSTLMSDAGGVSVGINATLTFDQDSANVLPDTTTISSGTYQPADYGALNEVYPAPAPVPTGANLDVFDGLNPAGAWNLFVNDDAGADVGSIASWGLDITLGGNVTINAGGDADDGTADNIDVVFTATNAIVTINGAVVFDEPLAGITSLTIDGSSDDDIVTMAGGDNLVSFPVAFNGGLGGVDTLNIDDLNVQGSSSDGLNIFDFDSVDINSSTFSGNADEGVDIAVVGPVTITNTIASNNAGEGINIVNSGAVVMSGITANSNDPGISVTNAPSYSLTNANVSDNDDHGIQLSNIAGDVTLIGVVANDNDADNDGIGDGLNADTIGGSLLVQGSTFRDTTGFGNPTTHQIRGVSVDTVTVDATFSGSNVVTGNQGFAGVVGDGVILGGVGGNLSITGGTYASNNGSGFIVSANVGGNLDVVGVNANDNIGDGLNVSGAITGTVDIGDSGFDGNTFDGIDLNGAGGLTTLNGVDASGNGDNGVELSNAADITFLAGTFDGNTGEGVNIFDAGAVDFTNVEANGNDPGILIDTVTSFTDTDGTYSNNADHGIQLIDIADFVTLTRTTANDNDGNNTGVGDGVHATANNNVNAIGGDFTVNGGTFDDTTGHADPGTRQITGIFVVGVGGNVLLNGSVDPLEADGNQTQGVTIDQVDGTVTFTDGEYSGNASDGIGLSNVTGLTTLTSVTAQSNGSDGIDAGNLTDMNVAGGDFTLNDDDGLDLDTLDNLTLTDVNASGNDANDGGAGNGASIFGVTTSLTILGGTYNGGGTQQDGINANNSPNATITIGSAAQPVVANGNDEDGIDLDTVGAVTITNVTANLNDPGIVINNAPSVSITGSNVNQNLDGGIYVNNITGPVTLTDDNANDNDADFNFVGNGFNATNVTGPIVILGGSYSDTFAGGGQIDGIFVDTSPTALIYIGNDGNTVSAVNANGNFDDGIDINSVAAASLDTVTANNNGNFGFEISNVSVGVLLTDLTLAGNGTNGGNLDTIAQVGYTTNKATNPAVDDSLTLTATTITRTVPAQQTIEYTAVGIMAIFTGQGDDTIDVDGTGATVSTTVFGGDGNDVITIAGSNLLAANTFLGDTFNDAHVTDTLGNFTTALATAPGNDEFILNVAADITATSLLIGGDGNAPAGVADSANRDRLTVNNAGAVTALSFDWSAGGDFETDILGFAIPVNIDTTETIQYNDTNGNDTVATLIGETTDDEITVVPVGVNSAAAFIGGNPYESTAEPLAFADSLPGFAGGGVEADFSFTGLINAAGIFVDGNGSAGPVGDQLFVYGQTENGIIDPVADAVGYTIFNNLAGYGSGELVNAVGFLNAFDDIVLTDTLVTVNNFVQVALDPLDFVQVDPTLTSGLIVDSGDELIPNVPDPDCDGFRADSIDVSLSQVIPLTVNGGDPPNNGVNHQGDEVNFLGTFLEVQVWSDKSVPPTVSFNFIPFVGSFQPYRESSIECHGPISTLTLTLVGDNNDPTVDQTDNFVVVGEDVDVLQPGGDLDGANELSLVINGSIDIPFRSVQVLNVLGDDLTAAGDNDADTLEVTPWSGYTNGGNPPSSPIGWGIQTTFNEGGVTGADDGDQQDLLIVNGLAGISEVTTLTPSDVQDGDVIVTFPNGALIANINYVSNLGFIFNGNDGSAGDTDRLILQGSNGTTPGLSGDDVVDVNYDNAGNAASPFLTLTDGAVLYSIHNITNYDVVTLDLQGGNDTVNVTDGAAAGGAGFANTTLNIFFGAGNDTFDASASTSTRAYTVSGGLGNDTLTGGAGDDVLNGDEGNDDLVGGDGDDILNGGSGFDELDGGNGLDQLNGGDDVDRLTINANSGLKQVDGGQGDDVLVVNGTAGADTFALNPLTPGSVYTSITYTGTVAGVADVEAYEIDGVGGSDAFDIGDLSSTSVRAINVAVGGTPSTIDVDGTAVGDNIGVTTPAAGRVDVAGLAYQVSLNGVSLTDILTINGGAGDDTIKANAGVEGQIGIVFNGDEGDDFLSADATLNGGAGNDTLVGGAGADTLNGGDGNDILDGGEGDDAVNGDAGDDTILVSNGVDTVAGGADFDTIVYQGTAAGDTLGLTGGAAIAVSGLKTGTINNTTIDRIEVLGLGGADTITIGLTGAYEVFVDAAAGNDTVNAAAATSNLTILGGDGDDTLTGGAGNDSIDGGAGNDTLVGGAGNDTINGGAGNDSITGGAGTDSLDGGDGTDTFTWSAGEGSDTVVGGGDGADSLIFNGSAAANVIGLVAASNHLNVTLGAITVDTVGIEHVQVNGLAGGDTITVGDLTTTALTSLSIALGGGADSVTVNGRNTADNLAVSTAGAGLVSVEGLAYDVDLTGAAVADLLTVNGNNGNDTLKANADVDTQIGIVLNGNAGDDYLSADATLNGGDGNDTLEGGAGADFINGDAGDDTIIFNAGAGLDTINGGDGFDIFLVNANGANNTIAVSQTAVTVDGNTETLAVSNLELFQVNSLGGNDTVTVTLTSVAGNIDAGSGNDIVNGSAATAALTIFGGDGEDTLTGGSVADEIHGGSGNDLITGLGGIDFEYGDAGNDTFGPGDAGADFLFGSEGADTFNWQPGDGSDSIQGGDDQGDVLNFLGSAAADAFLLSSSPTNPSHLNVKLGAATVDTAGVDQVIISALAGADSVTVLDLTKTEVKSLNIDLGAAGEADAVTLNGRVTGDDIGVDAPVVGTLNVQGLSYDVNITSTVALEDTLTINGNAGDDTIKANVLVENSVIIVFNGNAGDDYLSADATLNGGDGNDILIGGAGPDTLIGGDGNDLLTGNGGIDSFDGGAGYDTVVETRNANFTLTDTTLNIGAEGTDTLTSMENANLTGGQGANTFFIGAFTGDTTVTGAGGSDTVDFSTATEAIHIDLDAKDQDQVINLSGRTIVFGDIIENLTATPFNDTINVDIAQFNRTINGGLETSIPPGDRLNVDLLGSNPTTTKVPNGGKLGSFNGTVNGSGFTGTISYFDIETLVIKGGNSTPPDFSSATQYDVGDGPRGVVTADVNGDGKLDMIVANSFSNDISVRFGDGFGSFGALVNYSAGGKHAKQTTTVAVGDVDGDGDLDIVVTNRKTNNVSVLLNDGAGTFGAATLFSTGSKQTGKFPTAVKLGDMDNDGNLDIVTANANVRKNGSVSVLLGDGAGGFGAASVTKTLGRRPRDLVLIDNNGDGNLDVVATDLFSRNVVLMNGDGAGGLSAPAIFDVAITPNSIIEGDFNGDGVLDVVTTSLLSPRLSILLGVAGGGFEPVKEIKYPAVELDISINTADINGDGNLDLLIANRNDNTLSYMLGNGNGSFNNRVDFKTGDTRFREPVSIAVGDFNNDGAIDLMVANAGSDDVSVLIHVGIV